MTTRLTALRLVLLALLAGCDWGTKPGLPNNVGNDAAADVAWADTAPPPYDAVVTEDVPPPPDVPEPADAPVATPDAAPPSDAGVTDAAPPPMDAAATDDCRFTPSRDGETPPAGAVVTDGGYYANGRGEGCDPTRADAGPADAADATDGADVGDATDAADGGASDAPTDAVVADTADGSRP